MKALAGPVVVMSALLVLAGGLKLVRPSATAGALRALHLPSALALVRVLGAAEIVVGVVAGVSLAPAALMLLGAMYLGFAAFIAAALASDSPLQSCGCLGQSDTPPSSVHLAFNVTSAIVACVAAITGSPSLGSTLSDQPWSGVPFVLLVAVCVYACVVLATVLPLTFRSAPAS